MNEIQIPLNAEGAESLKDLKPGDKVCLSYVEGRVTANDGENLSFTPTDIEVDEEACGPMDKEPSDNGDSEGSSDQSSYESDEKKPIAVVAIGMGKKKM